MHKPFIYHILDIDNYQEIHSELVAHALAQVAACQGRFNHINLADLLAACPLLAQWFNTQDLTPRIAALILFPPGSDQEGTHTDSESDYLALNWGLANLEATWTAFYRLRSGDPVIKTQPLGRPWQHYPSADLEEIGRVNLVKPTVINAGVPHCVHNPTGDTRISMSFRFDRNPWHLV